MRGGTGGRRGAGGKAPRAPDRKVFALSIEAFRAPLEHYDAALEALWGDEHEAAALRGFAGFLVAPAPGGATTRRPSATASCRASSAMRIRAFAAAERAATVSLASISDNPVYIPPDAGHPLGRCISTGGYHNAMATPALDDLAGDLGRHLPFVRPPRLEAPERQGVAVARPADGGAAPGDSDGHGNVGYVPMAITGYLEQAKLAAQRTFIPGTESAGAGQDDVATPVFLAWTKEERAGRCLDAGLAMLTVVASQALHVTGRAAPPPLRTCWPKSERRPPVEADRVLGPELLELAGLFTKRAFTA